MPIGTAMQISASGLTAERLRLDVISNNIANVNTTRAANGQPFRRQEVVFAARPGGSAFASMLSTATGHFANKAAGNGVEVVAIQPDMTRDFKVVHDPGHPDADANGDVKMPNIEPITEMVDMISASRAYEGGVTAINAAKQMESRALEIGRA